MFDMRHWCQAATAALREDDMKKKQFENTTERRFIDLSSREFRAVKEDDKLYIEGYPIVYGERTILWPGVAEIIEQGAATEALKKRNTKVYWNHSTSKPMAGFKNGTLEVKEDDHGVWMRADVSGTVWGREGYEAIDSGIVAEMSFGFRVAREGQEWTEEENEDGSVLDIRKIKQFSDIPDFSPVSEPAYPTTEVYARSKDLICRDKPEPSPEDNGTSPEDDVTVTPTEILRQKINLKEKEMSK